MFAAFLDTSVLWPSLQRDFLLSLAAEGLYRPLWSEAVLEELIYHEEKKLAERGISDSGGRAERLVRRMREAFDDAVVRGWEPLEGSYGLPDPDDEHVVAAADHGGAGVIVTANLRDFPTELLPNRLTAVPPAQFALETTALNPSVAAQALAQIARRSGSGGRPARHVAEIIDTLERRYQMTEAAALMRAAVLSGETSSTR